MFNCLINKHKKIRKVTLKILPLLFASVAVISSCNNEEIILSDNDSEKALLTNCTIDSLGFKEERELIARFNRRKRLSKGMKFEEDSREWIETGTAKVLGTDITYETMKVYRKNDPKKFFYVMVTNLDIPYPFDDYVKHGKTSSTSDSWIYADDPANINTYGWLYSRAGVDGIKNYVYMSLPIYDKNTGEPKKGSMKKKVYGKLMTRRDLADIFEIPDEHENPFFVYDNNTLSDDDDYTYYYDSFVFGLDATGNKDPDEASAHSLGGYRDKYNVDDPEDIEKIRLKWEDEPDYILKQIYTKYYAEKNHCGRYWMAEADRKRHYLEIRRHLGFLDFDWSAFYGSIDNKSGDLTDYGYSVRFVFEPTFK